MFSLYRPSSEEGLHQEVTGPGRGHDEGEMPEEIGKIVHDHLLSAAAGLSLSVGLMLLPAVIWRCWTKYVATATPTRIGRGWR